MQNGYPAFPLGYDHDLALSEGWLLSACDDGVWEIQKDDNDPLQRFEDDDEACSFVEQRRAFAGSTCHCVALAHEGARWNGEPPILI